jgi:predicted nucleic acid-binding protein
LVLDTTPLIHLVRVGFHIYFDKLGVEIITTGEVLKEIKLDENFVENIAIKDLIRAGKIRIENPKSMKKIVTGTHTGEVSVISLAKETNSVAVIDDAIGRAYAESLNVKTVYSTFFIFRALKKRVIKRQKAIDFINKMIVNGWRCDIETYQKIISKIGRTKNQGR